MRNLKPIYYTVFEALANDPKARDSDQHLLCRVWIALHPTRTDRLQIWSTRPYHPLTKRIKKDTTDDMKMGNAATPNSPWSKYTKRECEICHKKLSRTKARRCVKHRIYTDERRKKTSDSHKGIKHTLESRLKMSGANSPNWKGGITPKNKQLRMSYEYKEWRKNVFTRDDYTCQTCGKRGVELHADHIKPFAYFPELRFELSNGRALCVPCHKLTDTYTGRAKKLYAKTK